MTPNRSRELSSDNVPLPGMDGIGSNRSEAPTTVDAIIERVAQHVPARMTPGFYSRKVSEAASDQGHGGLVEGHRKPVTTNLGAMDGDLPHEAPALDPFIESLEAFKPHSAEEVGKMAVHLAVAEVDKKNITLQADGDPVYAAALARAHQEKPRA